LGQQAPCKVPTLQEADLALIVTGSQVTLVPEPIILNAPTHRQFAWMVGRMIFLPPFIKKLMHFLMEKTAVLCSSQSLSACVGTWANDLLLRYLYSIFSLGD